MRPIARLVHIGAGLGCWSSASWSRCGWLDEACSIPTGFDPHRSLGLHAQPAAGPAAHPRRRRRRWAGASAVLAFAIFALFILQSVLVAVEGSYPADRGAPPGQRLPDPAPGDRGRPRFDVDAERTRPESVSGGPQPRQQGPRRARDGHAGDAQRAADDRERRRRLAEQQPAQDDRRRAGRGRSSTRGGRRASG